MSEVGKYIALVVEGKDRHEAGIAALLMLARIKARDIPDVFSLDAKDALPLESGTAQTLLEGLWQLQLEGYLADFTKLYALQHRYSRFELLETLEFRSACYRLGALTGYPIKIYGPDGLGIAWRSNLDRLLKGFPDDKGRRLYPPGSLWVMPAKLEA